ncbi:response regulator [Tautonia sp. JC769]|uniref:response regulator n=1 Tax=Tautonia sp. JC769 TaxID=3232135 RepID=UPI0034579EE7
MSDQDDPAPGTRVLIVDDNVDTVRMMKILLKRKGFQVQTANDGAEALNAAATFRPEVVLLDLTMPGMSGQAVASALREGATTADALIVAVSGYGDQGVPEAFDHLLVKPVDHEALMTLLERADRGPGA